jgi:hypothetical protein
MCLKLFKPLPNALKFIMGSNILCKTNRNVDLIHYKFNILEI